MTCRPHTRPTLTVGREDFYDLRSWDGSNSLTKIHIAVCVIVWDGGRDCKYWGSGKKNELYTDITVPPAWTREGFFFHKLRLWQMHGKGKIEKNVLIAYSFFHVGLVSMEEYVICFDWRGGEKKNVYDGSKWRGVDESWRVKKKIMNAYLTDRYSLFWADKFWIFVVTQANKSSSDDAFIINEIFRLTLRLRTFIDGCLVVFFRRRTRRNELGRLTDSGRHRTAGRRCSHLGPDWLDRLLRQVGQEERESHKSERRTQRSPPSWRP